MVDDLLKSALDEVGQLIDDAVRCGDFGELSSRIGSSMDRVIRSAADASIRAASAAADTFTEPASPGQEAARRVSEKMRAMREAASYESQKKLEKEAETDKYFARPPRLTGAVIMELMGLSGTIIFGLLTLVMAMLGAAINGVFGAPFAVMSGIFAAISLALMIAGRRRVARGRRFKSYRTHLAPKLYSDVRTLSNKMGLPEKTVVSDLKSFTENGMIKQGHFDEKEQTFIASDELYNEYVDSVRRERAASIKEAEAKKEAEAAADAYPPKVREILNKGNNYIERIRHANDIIPDEVISAKLDETENIVRKIFAEVEARPELADNLDMFMSYYLPTATKLITAYGDMDSSAVDVSNVRKAKKDIASSLDTFNEAFETLLDSFFREQAMDVSSDINVMKMMMKQDGLTKDDMSKMKASAHASAGKADEAKMQDAGIKEAAGMSLPQGGASAASEGAATYESAFEVK